MANNGENSEEKKARPPKVFNAKTIGKIAGKASDALMEVHKAISSTHPKAASAAVDAVNAIAHFEEVYKAEEQIIAGDAARASLAKLAAKR